MTDSTKAVKPKQAIIPQSNFKTPFVEKSIPLEIDEGCLLAVDVGEVLELKKDQDRDDFLQDLSRENAQLLINRLWQLPTESVEDVVVATLPARTTVLPREKPVPKPKALTKWREYAKSKGLQVRKKEKMVWDETAKEFRPRWGYKKANDEAAATWAVELPPGGDLSEDPFEKINNQKKERVAKNEFQRLRNIARAENIKISRQPQAEQSTGNLTKAFHDATKATASLGKFTDRVRNEPRDSRPGKKRKFESNLIDSKTERDKQFQILKEMASKRPILDTEKAARKQMQIEDKEKRLSGKAEKPQKGKKPRRAWLPPDKFEKSKKIEAIRGAKREARGLPAKGKKSGGKANFGKGGKAASKTRAMLKRSK